MTSSYKIMFSAYFYYVYVKINMCIIYITNDETDIQNTCSKWYPIPISRKDLSQNRKILFDRYEYISKNDIS
jgi:hypothetical protein